MLDWAALNKIGFSSVVSLGGSVDIDFGEIIDYLANDPNTGHILLYIEGVRDARRFMGSLRAAARVKPVILMKVGRHPAGSRAAVSHTGAIVGADDVFDAAVRRAGVVRVQRIDQLIAAAQALASHVKPRGERLVVITNGGGPGVMAADRAADLGLVLAELSPATLERLQGALPSNWSHGNPVDLIGDADSARYSAAISACVADDGVDGVLTILTPQAMTDAAGAARAIIAADKGTSKPLIACWMGEASVSEGRRLLQEAGIPVFRTPDPAVEMFAHVSAFYRNQRTLLQIPGPLSHEQVPDLAAARQLVRAVLADGRKVLSPGESRALLAAFHIPVVCSVNVSSAEAAVQAAVKMGFPVVMKINSRDITHKSDVRGVRINLADAEAVRAAYEDMIAGVHRLRPEAHLDGVSIENMIRRPNGRELMIGVVRDPVFGPAITFGSGGTAVEVLHDRSVVLPPLNSFLATEMIGATRISKMLGAFRAMPAINMPALESVLMRVSELVCELPEIDELDINPVFADEAGAIALDARVVLYLPAVQRSRYAHMAIHPYPSELVKRCSLPDGSEVTLRPIRPEDAQMEQAFVAGLSDSSRRFRFMNTVRELTPTMLVRFTQIDYDREMAFVAVTGEADSELEVGVVRYISNPDGETCEYAIVVADAWQGKGLGVVMLEALVEVARDRGLKSMTGYVLADNRPMLEFCRKLGFEIATVPDDQGTREATLYLSRK